MLNSASLKVVNNAKFSQRFVKPCYDSYSFSNLPAAISFLLTGGDPGALPLDVYGQLPTRYRNVVFFFIDAFGWRFFERYVHKYPFLKEILNRGVVSKLTSQFPSTTAAHVTCMHTGLNVGQSGIYEWNYYEPLVDNIISPLLFSYAGEKSLKDTLRNSSTPSSAFFPKSTFYQHLQKLGVTSHIFQNASYAASTYSEIVFRGATIHPYRTFQEALRQLTTQLTLPASTPGYYFLYFDRIDAACHNYGPFSKQMDDAVDVCLRSIEQIFYQQVQGKTPETLFIMTADHGQVEVDPQKTYYLNKQIPGITRSLKTNQRGNLLVPAGSARDMFLHIKDDCVDAVVTDLRQRLAGRAEVYTTKDLLAQNFFGQQAPTAAFLGRVGNVVVLPYKYESVWWFEEDKFSMHFQGHHGGLTPEEMEIPLLLLPLS